MTKNNLTKFILFMAFALIPTLSFSLIKLNVETLTKNYIDEGLILTNEFHASRIIEEGVESDFFLGEKLQFRLKVEFERDILNSGPSDLISLGGKLIYFSAFKRMEFDLDRKKLKLGKKEAYYIQIEKDKKIEVYFQPSIKGFSSDS